MYRLISKILVSLIATLVAGAILLEFVILHKRKALQMRAQAFLARPVPTMFRTNSIGGFEAGPGASVLSVSRALIERYANKGLIRQTSEIAAAMQISYFETAFCVDSAKTNKEASVYIEECNGILDEEGHMGFWQWIEDAIEFQWSTPGIEEENVKPSATTNKVSLSVFHPHSICG